MLFKAIKIMAPTSDFDRAKIKRAVNLLLALCPIGYLKVPEVMRAAKLSTEESENPTLQQRIHCQWEKKECNALPPSVQVGSDDDNISPLSGNPTRTASVGVFPILSDDSSSYPSSKISKMKELSGLKCSPPCRRRFARILSSCKSYIQEMTKRWKSNNVVCQAMKH